MGKYGSLKKRQVTSIYRQLRDLLSTIGAEVVKEEFGKGFCFGRKAPVVHFTVNGSSQTYMISAEINAFHSKPVAVISNFSFRAFKNIEAIGFGAAGEPMYVLPRVEIVL